MLARIDDLESDAGPRHAGAVKERLCAVTRELVPLDGLVRFVVGPDGTVVPDVRRKLPGRGVWVSAERAAVAAAVKSRAFARAFKAEVRVPADLDAQVQRLLEQHALDAAAMACKAGEVALGYGKAEAAVAAGRAIGLVHARDASPDGARKLKAAARRLGADAIPAIETFTSAQLDLAFGRSNVVHAALLAGSASQGFLGRYRRLERFLGDAHATASKA